MPKGEFESKAERKQQIVTINNNFRYIIHADGNGNHELQELTNCKQKDGSVIQKFVWRGWYSGIRDIAKAFINKKAEYSMSEEDELFMKDILKFYKQSHDEIIEHIDSLKG